MNTGHERLGAGLLDTASAYVAERPEDMGSSAKKLSAYEQFLEQPDSVVAEIIHGKLVTQARPAPRHAQATSVLNGELMGPFHRGRQGPGGWRIVFEPEVRFDADILVPDIAGWRRERMPKLPEGARFDVAPDWVCEVLSPSTQAIDRADKLPIYAAHGVRHAWLLDPASQTLEVYRLEGERWLIIGTHRDDAVVRAEPFDAIELELSALWER